MCLGEPPRHMTNPARNSVECEGKAFFWPVVWEGFVHGYLALWIWPCCEAEHHGRGISSLWQIRSRVRGNPRRQSPQDTTQWPTFTIKTKFPNLWTCRALQKTQTQRRHGTVPPLPYSLPHHLIGTLRYQVPCVRVSLRFWVPLANQTHRVGCWKLSLWWASQTAWD